MLDYYWMPVKILDKRIREGWFGGKSFYITVKFLEHREVKEINPSILEIKCDAEDYYFMENGSEQLIKMYPHRNGRLYPYDQRKK